MKRKVIIIIHMLLLVVISIPLLVSASGRNGINSEEDYVENIFHVRCEIHGEVAMTILFPPDVVMFNPSIKDTDSLKEMDNAEQRSIMRERSRNEAKDVLGFDIGYFGTENLVNICYLCALEHGMNPVRTFHDVMALGNMER